MTIVEFLNARLDEDEAKATAAQGRMWFSDGSDEKDFWVFEAVPESAAHIVNHEPERVLREAVAKRKIVAYCEQRARIDQPAGETEGDGVDALEADLVLLQLASVYADHPEFEARWAS